MKKKLILIPLLILVLVATLAIGCAGEQGLRGLRGATGEQGVQGEQGLQGELGLQGEQGEVGLQGVAGARGSTGAKGATGAVGATGEQGIQGEKGGRGFSGATGATGAIGVTGADGIDGEDGADGQDGEKGDTGDVGPEGSQGVQGDIGPQGIQGEQGATGPTSLFTVSLVSRNGGTATLTNTQAFSGNWSIALDATDAGDPDEGTVVITPIVPLALGYLQSVSWQEYLVMGYPPHIDIYLDNDGDGVADDSLNVEYAYNTMTHYAEVPMPYGALTEVWYATFSDDGSGPTLIDNTCYAWLNSGEPGPPIPAGGTALNHTGGTLLQWKAGTLGTFDATSTIIKIELEVDNWVVQSQAYVDQITINGIVIWAQ